MTTTPENNEARYVVATCHEGSDWCVRRATPEEQADDGEEKLTYGDALRFAREVSGGRFYDLTLNDAETIDCAICGGEVTAKAPAEYPYCRTCHYTGRAEERIRAEQIERFKAAFPSARSVAVEHTGGGCFWLAIRFEDDPKYYVLTDGEAALPTQNVADLDADPQAEDWRPIPDGGWGYVGRHDDTEVEANYESGDYEGTALSFDEDALASGGLSDEQAIAVVKADISARSMHASWCGAPRPREVPPAGWICVNCGGGPWASRAEVLEMRKETVA